MDPGHQASNRLRERSEHQAHDDRDQAKDTEVRRLVVGNYVYSILLGMSVPDISGKAIANLEIESLRHVAPTFHGDTLYGCLLYTSPSPRDS